MTLQERFERKTRAGHDVELWRDDFLSDHSIVGSVRIDGRDRLRQWRANGCVFLAEDCEYDLIPVQPAPAVPATPDYTRPISINGHPLQYLGLCDTTDPFRHALFCDAHGTFRATDAGQSSNNIGWVVNVPPVAPEVTVRQAVAEHEDGRLGVAVLMGEEVIVLREKNGTMLTTYFNTADETAEMAGWTIHTARETTLRGDA